MDCFSMDFIEQLLIWFVVLIVAIAIVRLLVPAFMTMVGAPPGGGIVVTILMYLLWGALAIFGIYIFFELISCLIGGSGELHLPHR